jgi:hypothetical protein
MSNEEVGIVVDRFGLERLVRGLSKDGTGSDRRGSTCRDG